MSQNQKPPATSVLEGDEDTFRQHKHDANKILKPVEEEWDQLDLWLTGYAENSYQPLLLKMSGRDVHPWTGMSRIAGYVRSTQKLSSQL
jgi:hypothetical protein